MKLAKKVLALVVAAAVVACCGVLAFAADPAYVLSNTVDGDTVTIIVADADAAGHQSGQFYLTWDSAKLTYVDWDVLIGSKVLGGADFNEATGEAGYYYKEAQVDAAADLYVFTFKLVDGFTGETTVTATAHNGKPVALAAGSTTIVVGGAAEDDTTTTAAADDDVTTTAAAEEPSAEPTTKGGKVTPVNPGTGDNFALAAAAGVVALAGAAFIISKKSK
ncbi:MAG: hypothetical protein K6C36_00795 [Clostridia bacterium]|nr:hypothetical protein [Clostridia bacterium]